jgi:hypothetical protein
MSMLIFCCFVNTQSSAICPPEMAETSGNKRQELADRRTKKPVIH